MNVLSFFGLRLVRASAALPRFAAEENDNGENFEAARQHIHDQDDLGDGADAGEVGRRSDHPEPGPDIVEAGEDGGQILGQPVGRGERNDGEARHGDKDIRGEIGVGVGEDLFGDRFAREPDGFDLLRVHNLGDVALHDFQEHHDARAFEPAPGTSGAGADRH